MCDCASCEHTDRLAGLPDLFGFIDVPYLMPGRTERAIPSFHAWPCDDPKGPRANAAEYRSHVAHAWAGVSKRIPFTPGQPPKFNTIGLVMPVAPAPKSVLDWINRSGPQFERVKKASPTKAEPARPAQTCKPEQHFPAQDRPRETAVIYAMPKSTKEKRPRGRPAIQGRRVVIKLEDEQIKRAEKLGGGNVAAGIRKALSAGKS